MELNDHQKKILAILYYNYPDRVSKDKILAEVGINQDDLQRDIVFLKEEHLIEILEFIGGNFLAKLTSNGVKEINRLEAKKQPVAQAVTITADAVIKKDIDKIRDLQENIINLRADIESKTKDFDNKLNGLYARLIEIFGVFASILALVLISGNAIFNSKFSVSESVNFIIVIAGILAIFIIVIHHMLKN